MRKEMALSFLAAICLLYLASSVRSYSNVPNLRTIMVILMSHNENRRNETASNMKKLKWSGELARMASDWSEFCKFYRGNLNSTRLSYRAVGQSLFVSTESAKDEVANYRYAVGNWTSEKKYYDSNTGKCTNDCSRYTQVVWANSSEIGCAAKVCAKVESFAKNNAFLVVCNYGPGGNVVGQLPYKKGSPCADCPKSCSDKLCE